MNTQTKKHELEPVSAILYRVAQQIKEQYDVQKDGPFEIREEWEKIVGREISMHARPKKFVRGIITVEVDSPAWLHELKNFGKKTLLKTLKSRWNWIKDIRFKTGDGLNSI